MEEITISFFKITAIAVCLVSFWISISVTGTHPASDKNVIVKTHRDSIGWVLTKDQPFLESVLAHDDRLFIFNPDSEGTVGWKDTRWTGVIEKHDGKWKIVHTH